MADPYVTRLRKHLDSYKEAHFPETERVTKLRRNKHTGEMTPHVYDHILPRQRREENVLRGIHAPFWDYWKKERRNIPLEPGERLGDLHRDFAHLNSSQAMCFNLFFPFLGLTGARSDLLLNALDVQVAPVRRWHFEFVPDDAEETNFDCYIELESGQRLFFEVKLSESGFGSAQDDESHRGKLRDSYGPLLAGIVRPEFLDLNDETKRKRCLAKYQVLRNLSYLGGESARTTRVFFLGPKENGGMRATARFLGQNVLAEHRSRVSIIYLEELLARLQAAVAAETPALATLSEHLARFAEKYVIAGAV